MNHHEQQDQPGTAGAAKGGADIGKSEKFAAPVAPAGAQNALPDRAEPCAKNVGHPHDYSLRGDGKCWMCGHDEDGAQMAPVSPQNAESSSGGEALKALIDTGLSAIAALPAVSPAMKTWPEEIYLSTGEDEELAPFSEYQEVSWCDHPENSVDVRYVREDVAARAAAFKCATSTPIGSAGAQNAEAIRNAAYEHSRIEIAMLAHHDSDPAYLAALKDAAKAIRALQSGTATSKTGEAE